MLDLQANKDKFIQIFKGEIHREGAEELLAWLESTDFFESPYTGQYVLSCKGGLCQHALDHFRVASELLLKYREQDPYIFCDPDMLDTDEHREQAIAEVDESLAICTLLCSIGIADSWVIDVRKVKNDATGKWDSIPYYRFDESFTYGGAGDKSSCIVQQFMHLHIEEMQAIRYHRQGKDIPYGNNFEDSFYTVYETNRFAALIGVAHNEAHNILDQLIWEKVKLTQV